MEAAEAQPNNVIPISPMVDPKRTPKLALALAKAQLEIQNAEKNADVDIEFKNGQRQQRRYADLAAVLNAVREPLAKNELAFMQFPTTDKTGVTVLGRLMHSSGEYAENSLWLPVALQTPQGYGSSITYARRYQASAMLGVAQEDDDGAGGPMAAGKAPPPPKVKPQPPAKPGSVPIADIPEAWKEPLDQMLVHVSECQTTADVDNLVMKNQDFAKDVASVREVARKAFKAKREELAKKEGK